MSDDLRRKNGVALYKQLFAGVRTGVGARPPKRFAEYSLKHLFGDVWQDETLALAERSLLTCGMLVAMNREAEQRLHFVGARNVGVPREKLEAMITHAAHYAGWPCAASAFRVLSEVWPEQRD